MTGTFTLTAWPTVLSEGDFKGHLEFLTFVAKDGYKTEKWTAVNTGTLAEAFSKIVSRPEANAILERLKRGEIVLFPGFWALDEIKHKFGGPGNE
nr:hypothetical protein [uncultured bacterium]